VVLERLLDPGRPAALLLDFDGTLVPIRRRPQDVVLSGAVAAALERLSRSPDCLVALVSGRSLADLRARAVLPERAYLAGNHGLEMEGPDFSWVHPGARDARPQLQAACSQARSVQADYPGLLVEDKDLSASIHYRGVEESRHGSLLQEIRALAASWEGRLRVTWGKCVMELRPPVDWDKGRAALRLLEQTGFAPGSALVVGDDRTDESTFTALPQALTVRVGEEAAGTAARYRLDDPGAVARILDRLAEGRCG
jgi:trehalose 6-phosphate phosphatase